MQPGHAQNDVNLKEKERNMQPLHTSLHYIVQRNTELITMTST